MSKNSKRLLHAARHGNLEEVRQLIQENDVDINCKDSYGNNPLKLACFKGHFEVVKTLIDHGVDVNM